MTTVPAVADGPARRATSRASCCDNNNNNNNHDNVYGAVIMTKVVARIHPVRLMKVDWAPGGRQPPDQANQLWLWVHRKLAAISHIHHRHCYCYSARKLILILPSHGCGRSVWQTGHWTELCWPETTWCPIYKISYDKSNKSTRKVIVF